MKTFRHCAAVVFLVAVCSALTWADNAGKHPYYVHSLTDLRYARALLERTTPSDKVNDEEQKAISEIDQALNEIKQASIDDGKNVNDHPPVDGHLNHKGRYHRALELLDKVHHDIAQEEDDASIRGLRDRAIRHVDEAHRLVAHLILQASND
jgi:hypothetical protein